MRYASTRIRAVDKSGEDLIAAADGSKTQRLPRSRSRKNLEETLDVLRTSEAFLGTVLDNLPVALFVKDASDDFRMTLWNKKQEWITTIPRERALGKTDYDLFSEESAKYFREVDESVIRTGKPLDVPEEIVDTEEGGEIWLHTTKVPVTDEASGRQLVVGISEDITERIHGRQQLEKLNQNLSQANAELKSTQLQLIQAEKLESIGRMAAGVAHEVKNPLALLLMGVEYLTGGVDPDDSNVEEILKEMREAIGRADHIIRGMVDFSSERQLQLEIADVLPLLEHALLLVRHEVTRNSVEVVTDIENDLPPLKIDHGKFEQILVNLFNNAIHAMSDVPNSRLEVKAYCTKLGDVPRDQGARTANHLRSGDEVVIIEVSDNGSGISEENLSKIFDPFFTTKATGVGTGLGLSVVRKIVELHRGGIEVENRMLGGVRVRITLKVPKPDREAVDSNGA